MKEEMSDMYTTGYDDGWEQYTEGSYLGNCKYPGARQFSYDSELENYQADYEMQNPYPMNPNVDYDLYYSTNINASSEVNDYEQRTEWYDEYHSAQVHEEPDQQPVAGICDTGEPEPGGTFLQGHTGFGDVFEIPIINNQYNAANRQPLLETPFVPADEIRRWNDWVGSSDEYSLYVNEEDVGLVQFAGSCEDIEHLKIHKPYLFEGVLEDENRPYGISNNINIQRSGIFKRVFSDSYTSWRDTEECRDDNYVPDRVPSEDVYSPGEVPAEAKVKREVVRTPEELLCVVPNEKEVFPVLGDEVKTPTVKSEPSDVVDWKASGSGTDLLKPDDSSPVTQEAKRQTSTVEKKSPPISQVSPNKGVKREPSSSPLKKETSGQSSVVQVSDSEPSEQSGETSSEKSSPVKRCTEGKSSVVQPTGSREAKAEKSNPVKNVDLKGGSTAREVPSIDKPVQGKDAKKSTESPKPDGKSRRSSTSGRGDQSSSSKSSEKSKRKSSREKEPSEDEDRKNEDKRSSKSALDKERSKSKSDASWRPPTGAGSSGTSKQRVARVTEDDRRKLVEKAEKLKIELKAKSKSTNELTAKIAIKTEKNQNKEVTKLTGEVVTPPPVPSTQVAVKKIEQSCLKKMDSSKVFSTKTIIVQNAAKNKCVTILRPEGVVMASKILEPSKAFQGDASKKGKPTEVVEKPKASSQAVKKMDLLSSRRATITAPLLEKTGTGSASKEKSTSGAEIKVKEGSRALSDPSSADMDILVPNDDNFASIILPLAENAEDILTNESGELYLLQDDFIEEALGVDGLPSETKNPEDVADNAVSDSRFGTIRKFPNKKELTTTQRVKLIRDEYGLFVVPDYLNPLVKLDKLYVIPGCIRYSPGLIQLVLLKTAKLKEKHLRRKARKLAEVTAAAGECAISQEATIASCQRLVQKAIDCSPKVFDEPLEKVEKREEPKPENAENLNPQNVIPDFESASKRFASRQLDDFEKRFLL